MLLGQYNFCACDYDPQRGRFTTQDPWSGDASSPVTLNKYLFANADPLQNQDPSGWFSGGEALATMGIIGGLSAVKAGIDAERSEQVGSAWLGKFFIDYMALNIYFSIEDETLVASQVMQAIPGTPFIWGRKRQQTSKNESTPASPARSCNGSSIWQPGLP